MKMFSHSRLDTFDNCNLQFKYRYIDEKETGVETVEAFMGKRVHETLERLYEIKMENGQIPLLDALLQYYRNEWNNHVHDDIRIVKKDKTLDEYREKGKEQIKTYYNRYHPFNQVETVSLEERVTLPLGNTPYTIQGYIDRLARDGSTYEIHDYKTGNYVPSREALEKDQQLTLYGLAVLQTYSDAEDVELVWHYLAHDEEVRVSPSRDVMEEVEEDVIAMIEEVQTARENDAFPPTVSKLCHWCEFKEICPEWEHVYQENKLPDNIHMADNAGTLVDKYAAVKTAEDAVDHDLVEKLEEALVVYAVKNNTQQLQGERGTVRITFEQVPALPETSEERDNLQSVLEEEDLWQYIDELDVEAIDEAVTMHIDEAEQERVAQKVAKHLDTQKQPDISFIPH